MIVIEFFGNEDERWSTMPPVGAQGDRDVARDVLLVEARER
jgi:hypothetical protein